MFFCTMCVKLKYTLNVKCVKSKISVGCKICFAVQCVLNVKYTLNVKCDKCKIYVECKICFALQCVLN